MIIDYQHTKNHKNKLLVLTDYFILVTLALALCTFILYPVYSVIKSSFIVDGTFSLELYQNLFAKNSKLFYNSMFVATLTTILSTIVSTIVAIYISFSSGKVKKFLLLLLMLTMISPPFVSSMAYIALFGRRGFITYGLLGLTLNTYGWHGIVLMQTLGSASMNSLILVGTINGINKDIVQSSLDLGANISYTLRKIILPMMRPGIMAIAFLSFVRSLSDFGTPMIIGGSFNVLATHAYLNVIAYSNIAKASAICVLILIPASLFFFFYRKIMNNNLSYNNIGNSTNNILAEDIKARGLLWRVIEIFALFFLLINLLKYGTIFLSALTRFRFGKMYFTLENVYDVSKYIGKSFGRSIVYGVIVGVGGGILGFLLSYYVQFRKVKGAKILDFIATIPNVVPGVFLGIGYILAFNHKPLELTGTAAIVILNIIFRVLPSNTRNCNSNFAQMDPQLEDAGKDLGAHNIFILKDLLFPMSKSTFVINFINNFKTTMTTVGSIIFLVYPGKKLATLEMFAAIQSGNYGTGAAAACAIIIITLTINVLMSRLLMRWENVR